MPLQTCFYFSCTSSESSYIWLAIKLVLPPLDAWLVRLMEEAICGGVKTWQPGSILSNESQAIKRQAAQSGCTYARPAAPWFGAPDMLQFFQGSSGHWPLQPSSTRGRGGHRLGVSPCGALWATGSRQGVWGCSGRRGGGCRGWGAVGRFRKQKDMAPFPISLADNKKGMLEKGKQREESTKTKARARSV